MTTLQRKQISVKKKRTVCLSLPNGVAQPKATCDDVEHGNVLTTWPPPEQHHEQSRVEERRAQHCGIPLHVLHHVTYAHGTDGVDAAETDQDGADLLNAERAVYVRLQRERG